MALGGIDSFQGPLVHGRQQTLLGRQDGGIACHHGDRPELASLSVVHEGCRESGGSSVIYGGPCAFHLVLRSDGDCHHRGETPSPAIRASHVPTARASSSSVLKA